MDSVIALIEAERTKLKESFRSGDLIAPSLRHSKLTGSIETLTNLLALLKRVPAPPESGWLLERNMTPDGPEYLTVDVGGFSWTTDNLKALHLARREDADKLAEIIDDCEHVREHQWG